MRALRNIRIGVRLGASFGLLAVLLAAVTVVGLANSAAMEAAQERLVASAALSRDFEEMKYAAADFNGWQTAYAFDAHRGVANAADDSVGSRAEFLAAVQTFRDHLERAGAADLDDSMQRDVDQITSDFASFMQLDDSAVALVRKGTPAAIDEASDLVMNEAVESFASITASLTRLTDSIAARAVSDAAEAGDASDRARLMLTVVGLLALALAIVLAVVITRSITGPLRRTVDVLGATAGGDLTTRVDDPGRDEIGQLGSALNHTLDTLNETIHGIAGGAASLSTASEELSAVSQEMSAAAEETAVQAASVSASAEQVSQSLQSVSAGAEELGTSVREISANTSNAAAVAAQAVVVAGDTQTTVAQLGTSSGEIGEVIKVITSIAQQTNLLALNATIEAARAGEAGKGFAVVANEVKELARMTATSSEEIARKIEGIQRDSRRAVDAIDQITRIIGQINDTQIVIAASVEEQSATTREIGRSLTEAAAGSQEIARNITGVAQTAQGTTQGAADTQQAATQLARLAGDQLAVVGQFRLAQGLTAGGPAATGTVGAEQRRR